MIEKNRTHQEEAVGEFFISESSGEVFSEGKASRVDDFQVTDVPAEAEDWFLQLRNGKSVHLSPEVVGSHKFRSESLLPPFSVGEPLEIPANISLVMEEDGSVRPFAKSQVMGQVSASGGSEMVVYEEDDSVFGRILLWALMV